MIQPINYNPINIQMPTAQRNYTIFDKQKVDYYVSKKEQSLPYLKKVLASSQDEKEIVEALYIIDRLLDNGTKGIPAMYPLFSRFNDMQSPHIQTFLAGIYRKTQVPDAFGPLVVMLIKNAIKKDFVLKQDPQLDMINKSNFDPNEEIGGAILEYIKNYSNNPKKIDYSA